MLRLTGTAQSSLPLQHEWSGGCGDCSTPLRSPGLVYHFNANGLVVVVVALPPSVCLVDDREYLAQYVLVYLRCGACWQVYEHHLILKYINNNGIHLKS